MTAKRTSSRAVRPWRALRKLSNRTSLRTKLITALLALVIFALAAMGIAGVSLLRGYLIGPIDNTLTNVGLQQVALGAAGGDPRDQALLSQNNYTVWLLPNGGTPVSVVQPTSAFFGSGQGQVLPARSLSAIQSWLSA